MKYPSLYLFFALFTPFILPTTYANEDEFAKLDIISNKIPIQKENDLWLNISVPFKFLKHPRLESLNGRRPSTIEGAFNPKFINNVKVKLWICFENKFKKDLLGTSSGQKDTDYYQYYDSEVEYQTLEFDRSTKTANFLFPAAIAERDGFLEAYVKPVGYVIEISYDGEEFALSDGIYFNYRGATPQVLESFKSQAKSQSTKNKGILIPAHEISMNYLQGMGPPRMQPR